MTGITARQARLAIESILASVADDELPSFTEIEVREGHCPVAWIGNTGKHLGSAKSGGAHDPLIYRRNASRDALEFEATCRLDQRYKDSGYDVAAIKDGLS